MSKLQNSLNRTPEHISTDSLTSSNDEVIVQVCYTVGKKVGVRTEYDSKLRKIIFEDPIVAQHYIARRKEEFNILELYDPTLHPWAETLTCPTSINIKGLKIPERFEDVELKTCGWHSDLLYLSDEKNINKNIPFVGVWKLGNKPSYGDTSPKVFSFEEINYCVPIKKGAYCICYDTCYKNDEAKREKERIKWEKINNILSKLTRIDKNIQNTYKDFSSIAAELEDIKYRKNEIAKALEDIKESKTINDETNENSVMDCEKNIRTSQKDFDTFSSDLAIKFKNYIEMQKISKNVEEFTEKELKSYYNFYYGKHQLFASKKETLELAENKLRKLHTEIANKNQKYNNDEAILLYKEGLINEEYDNTKSRIKEALKYPLFLLNDSMKIFYENGSEIDLSENSETMVSPEDRARSSSGSPSPRKLDYTLENIRNTKLGWIKILAALKNPDFYFIDQPEGKGELSKEQTKAFIDKEVADIIDIFILEQNTARKENARFKKGIHITYEKERPEKKERTVISLPMIVDEDEIPDEIQIEYKEDDEEEEYENRSERIDKKIGAYAETEERELNRLRDVVDKKAGSAALRIRK